MASFESVRGTFGGFEVLRSESGEIVRLVVDRLALTVVVDGAGGEEVARASVPYPQSGYGGHELLLSSDERYLALWLYSGQSEVGYELFTYRPSLSHIGSFPYVRLPIIGPGARGLKPRTNLRVGTRFSEAEDGRSERAA